MQTKARTPRAWRALARQGTNRTPGLGIALYLFSFALSFLLAVTADAAEGPVRPPAPAPTSIYERFDRHAREAEDLLAGHSATPQESYTAQLRTMRALLAADREKAIALSAEGSLELRILKAQIDALGPLPEDGQSEPQSVTDQRARLEAQLSALMRPSLHLEAAQARASVLVNELDARQKALNRHRLFAHDVSALDPRQWVRTVPELAGLVTSAGHHLASFVHQNRKITQGSITAALGTSFLLLVLTPVLAFLAWKWLSGHIEARRARTHAIAGKLAWTLLLDAMATLLFAVVLIVMVIATLVILLPMAERDMLRSIVPVLIGAGALIAIGRWLGRGAVLSPFPQLRLIRLPEDEAHMANRIIARLTLLLAAITVVSALDDHGSFTTSNISHLLSAILSCWGAWLLWRLVAILRKAQSDPTPAQTTGDHEPIDFLTPISRLLQLFALASVIAALVGYAILSRFLFSATLITLAVLVAAIYLHRSITLVVNLLAEGRLSAYRRLLKFIPLLAGLVLTVLVLPVIAVIWGFSGAEIADGVRLLRNGVDLGDVHLSIGDVFTFGAVLFLGIFITRWVQRFLRITVLPEFAMDAGAEAALLTFLGYLGVTFSALVAIATTGLDLSNLAFVAGALSVGLGFGLQSVVENFTSGILLLIERPIKVGDWIEVGENSGIVRKISVRSTHVETFDRHQIIVPNSQLIAGIVRNRTFTTGPSRIVLPVGVAYGSDLEKVREVLLAIAREDEGVLAFPEPAVVMDGFGESSIDLRLLAFVRAATDGAATTSRLNFTVARRFEREGIEIPFPQRDLHLRSAPKGWPPTPPCEEPSASTS